MNLMTRVCSWLSLYTRPHHLHHLPRLSPQRYVIPRSEIRRVRVLGSGTFGEIVLGEWLGTCVALKTQV